MKPSCATQPAARLACSDGPADAMHGPSNGRVAEGCCRASITHAGPRPRFYYPFSSLTAASCGRGDCVDDLRHLPNDYSRDLREVCAGPEGRRFDPDQSARVAHHRLPAIKSVRTFPSSMEHPWCLPPSPKTVVQVEDSIKEADRLDFWVSAVDRRPCKGRTNLPLTQLSKRPTNQPTNPKVLVK